MIFNKHVNKYYKKYFWYFFFGLLSLIFVDIIQTYIPEITGNIVNAITDGRITSSNYQYLIKECVYILVIGIGMFVGRLLWRIFIFGECIRVTSGIRRDMFLKSLRLSQRFYRENKTGGILSYFSNDIETLDEAFGFGIVQFVDGVFLLLLSLIKMFRVNSLLAFFLLIPLFCLGICAFFVDKLMEKKYEKRQKAFESMSDYAQENFTGIRVIKAFVKEKNELRAFKKQALNNKNTNLSYARASVILDVAFDILIYLIFGVILFGGSYLVYQNVISNGENGINVGQLVEFIGYADTLIWPVFALAGTINLIARARTSMKRIATLLDEKEEICDSNDLIEVDDITPSIEFKNFSFQYPTKEGTFLKDINLRIEEGESIGIVGKIGSGKSTLANMLFRLFNVEEGTLFIGGHDIMHLPIKQVRELCGYCPQDNFLFSNTIKSNIAFSNPDASLDEVSRAAIFASVSSNIEEFPLKYDTLIGEKGVSLSGGQKQRISIARAILKDPKILILDDSVSAVDIKCEEEIIHNIKKERKGKTTLIVASRVSTVASLDRIIVLSNGSLEAFGTHEQLLVSSPTYAKMVELQSLESEMEDN